MSKWIEDRKDGTYKVSDIDMNRCKYEINEVCCNDVNEEMLTYFVDEETCAGCKYFTQEDGEL